MPSCPSCFIPLPPEQTSWLCVNSQCRPVEDLPASEFLGVKVLGKVVTDVGYSTRDTVPQGVACRQCGAPTAQRACPYCHYALPADWLSSATTCIALAGARYTGKSFYMAIAVRQLQQLGARVGTAVDFADDSTKARYQRVYEGPLFKERGIIQTTPRHDVSDAPQRLPFIFSLGIRNGRRHYLIFRDVAGEDLESDAPNEKHLRFLAHADNVMFLFDPLRVRSITDMFPGLVDQQQTGGDPLVVLNNVLRIIGSRQPRLSVVLAKFDTLERLRDVGQVTWAAVMSHTGAAMLRDPSLSARSYDEADGRLLHEEVRSMLISMRAQRLITALERPTNGNRLDHRFFAVSVLGESVRNQKLDARGITPFRCLDPLRWELARSFAM